MTNHTRRTFTTEFRLEAAQLVTEHGYSVREAAEAMSVSKSAMDRWVRQLKQEQRGISPKASPLTPDLDDNFGYAILNRIFNFLRNGAQLIVFHKNLWYFRDNKTWLDSGAFTSALEQAASIQAIVMGKSSPIMFLSAMETMGLEKEQVLVVGDDVTTDILGARNTGLTGLLLGSGKFKAGDCSQYQVPTLILFLELRISLNG